MMRIKGEVPEQFLTAEQMAGVLGVARETIYRLAARGELEVVRLGTRALRFPASQLDLLGERARGHGE